MNRSERRRLKAAKTKADVSYNLKPEAIQNNIYKELEDKIMSEVILKTSISTFLVLHDEFKFGKVRIGRFFKEQTELFDAINKGYVNFKDIQEELYRLGIDVDVESLVKKEVDYE